METLGILILFAGTMAVVAWLDARRALDLEDAMTAVIDALDDVGGAPPEREIEVPFMVLLDADCVWYDRELGDSSYSPDEIEIQLIASSDAEVPFVALPDDWNAELLLEDDSSLAEDEVEVQLIVLSDDDLCTDPSCSACGGSL